MMTSIKHLALGCCILSAMAGMLRSFWPDNGFKPVINAVLMLYIITAALSLGRGTDWSGLGRALRAWTRQSAAPTDYSDYGEKVGGEAIAAAVREVLERSGIEASVSLRDGVCLVALVHPADRSAADELLAQNCGTLPYKLLAEGDAP